MQHGNHLKQMLIGGAVLLVGLLAFGVPTGPALITAAALACPLGMAAMMFFMMRGQAHGIAHNHADPPAAVPAPVRTPLGPQE
jgi:hypothetical protein